MGRYRWQSSDLKVLECPDCKTNLGIHHSCKHLSCPHCFPQLSQQQGVMQGLPLFIELLQKALRHHKPMVEPANGDRQKPSSSEPRGSPEAGPGTTPAPASMPRASGIPWEAIVASTRIGGAAAISGARWQRVPGFLRWALRLMSPWIPNCSGGHRVALSRG